MHRNTLIIVCILSVLAALVIGVNLGRNTSRAEQAAGRPSLTPTPTRINMHTYTSPSCGISLTYPEYFTLLENPINGAVFTNTRNPADAVVVACQKDIPRVPLTEDQIETVQIGSIAAQLYHDASAKDGTPVDKLIFTHPGTKMDVYIAGFGDEFKAVLRSLQLIQP